MPNSPQNLGPIRSDAQDRKVRDVLKRAIAVSGKSRPQIAEELTARLQRRPSVTHHMLNDFIGLSDEKWTARFPAAWVPAFCEVTGSEELLFMLLTPRIRALMELGECELAENRQQREKSKIMRSLLPPQ